MKRLTLLPLAFLMALFLSLTASAADYAIHSVTLDGGAVTVSVTAPNDCALWVGAYSADGVMIAADGTSVSGKADAQTLTLNFDGVASDAYAKAFLLDKETFAPLCVGDSRIEYVILYADGVMVFQHSNIPESGREVKNTYALDITKSYERYYEHDGYALTIPWSYQRDSILQVEFSEKIQPKSTVSWFDSCSHLTEIKNLDYLETAYVVNMNHMFSDCSALTSLNVSDFNTANVTDMSGMFSYCSSLTALDVSGFNTANVTNMNHMFGGCSSLMALDVSGFNTANVTNMQWMFYGCSVLTSLDVSQFNTAHVIDMSCMFDGCSSLTALDVSGFNTANVIYMDEMFEDCKSLTALDISGFNTANVTNMNGMFDSCTVLTTLDVSGFNTANVTNMKYMFWKCPSLTKIYASDKFVTNQVTSGDNMFRGCTSLVGGAGTTYDTGHVNVEYACIDGGPENPGYFTAKS